MKRGMLGFAKGDTTVEIDKAYQVYTEIQLVKILDTTERQVERLESLNTLLQTLDVWLDKKITEYQSKPNKLLTHKRFHTMLALKEFIDSELQNLAQHEATNQAYVSHRASIVHLIQPTSTPSSASASSVPELSQFKKLHLLFAPPNMVLTPYIPSQNPTATPKPASNIQDQSSTEEKKNLFKQSK
jgi:hypothetical protein